MDNVRYSDIITPSNKYVKIVVPPGGRYYYVDPICGSTIEIINNKTEVMYAEVLLLKNEGPL